MTYDIFLCRINTGVTPLKTAITIKTTHRSAKRKMQENGVSIVAFKEPQIIWILDLMWIQDLKNYYIATDHSFEKHGKLTRL